MKCKFAKVDFHFSEHFTESVQEMIDDGILTNRQEIQDYIAGAVIEDVEEWARKIHNDEEIARHVIFDIILE